MMLLARSCFSLLIILGQLILLIRIAEAGNHIPQTGLLLHNVSNASSSTGSPTSSRWLKKVSINQRPTGCWNRPWICKEDESPKKNKKLCCLNRCVDVSSDVNNCGLCGIKCPFTWQCCRGICIDTNINPFHCGKCDHKCPFFSLCIYGMCGYAQPLPPFPFPPKPPHPFPPKPPHPFPPKPPHPFPPKPPHPFPPKPPHPFPPKPPHPPLHSQSQSSE
ncbi:hypothetical protein AgCh_014312 [Apium graveolens]